MNYSKIISVLIILLLLNSCSHKLTKSELTELGSSKYNLFIFGLSSESEMKLQFSKEVQEICGENYEIEEIVSTSTKDEFGILTHTNIKGDFVCKD